ncbi:MAG: glycoside hydrolase family 99-like domain-containing protein [Desulfofustis sp. PB-SRB1]|nr:glycoside hydrolase family 99-like domain-containing protein [Desulfofustis sp. PB-SRB1]
MMPSEISKVGERIDFPDTNRKTAILVLGMHRSGTSAVTRVASLLGADLPQKLMPSSKNENDLGFWESTELYMLHEELLASGGSYWDDWRRFNPDWYDSPAAENFTKRCIDYLQKDFGSSYFFVLKDPRMCRLVPFWINTLQLFSADVRVLLPIRNPREVAASLKKRNDFNPVKSYMLWLRHVIEAEYYTREVPRFIFQFDELLADWRALISRASVALDLSWPKRSAQSEIDIDNFLDSRLKHHSWNPQSITQSPSLAAWIKDAYTALLKLVGEPDNVEMLDVLDATREEFNRAELALGTVVAVEERNAQELVKAKKEFEQVIAEKDQALEQLAAEKDQALEKLLAEKDKALAQGVAQKNEVLQRNQQTNELLHKRSDQRNKLLHRLDHIQSSHMWSFVRPMLRIESKWPRFTARCIDISRSLRGVLSLHPIRRKRLRRDYNLVINSGLFDWQWYIEQNPEVVAEGHNPLWYWLELGWKQGHYPNKFFDPGWYREEYSLADQPDANPLLHYLVEGARHGISTHPDFDMDAYLEVHPEIMEKGMNPLAHFLAHGGDDKQREQVAAGYKGHYSELTKSVFKSHRPGPYYEDEKVLQVTDLSVKAIALYLPQFHPIPENDQNWGKGFTEWSNTTRAIPRFSGHYQPRLPGELGYYDLRNPSVLRRQIELAKNHGIYGFCYHYYWFNGKSVLRKPLENHFENQEYNFPFCINWANEPWTTQWDGHRKSQILIDQHHTPDDDLLFIRALDPFFRDTRYIRIDGKPLLIIYRPNLFPNCKETIERWQNYCIDNGIGELFMGMVQSFDHNDPRTFGFDAAIEFPPLNIVQKRIENIHYFPHIDPPEVYKYENMVEESLKKEKPGYQWFRGVTLAWDNSARRSKGIVYNECTPANYAHWLNSQCNYAVKHLPAGKRLVFINAWNEWAEGTYLEPDAYFGYAFLNRTGEVLSRFTKNDSIEASLESYIKARDDDATWERLAYHLNKFALPTSADEAKLPEPAPEDVAAWLQRLNEALLASPNMVDTEVPDVSILVPVFNQFRYTASCLVSILEQKSNYSFEIIVGDDRSSDSTHQLSAIATSGFFYVRHVQNLGFLKNCNTLATKARGRYLVLLNNDTVVLPGWLDELIGTLERDSKIGLVGSKLVYPDGRLQEAGSIMWEDASGLNWGNRRDPMDPEFNYLRDVDYCSGASIAIPKDIWMKLGGFDSERYQNAYYEDTDLAFRIREELCMRVVYQPLSHLLHFEGVSSGRSLDAGIKQYQTTNRPLFLERWCDVLKTHGNCENIPRNYLDRTRDKRILLIDTIVPLPDQDSGSIDTFNYLRILLSMGYSVSFLPYCTTASNSYIHGLQRMGVRVFHDPFYVDFQSIIQAEAPKADIIFIYRGVAHDYLPMLRAIVPDKPIIFNTVDLHFVRLERAAELSGKVLDFEKAAITKRKELLAMKLADITIVVSKFEKKLLSQVAPDVKTACIPIVREIAGRSIHSFVERCDILFIGGFLHPPNVDAVHYFLDEIWPLVLEQRESLGRDCRFLIAGSNIPDEIKMRRSDTVAVLGFVPDLTNLFGKILISVAPLRFGAGLKGKVIDSLSHGVPVVGTSVSMEGSGLLEDTHLLRADTPEEIARSIVKLHNDQDLWERLSVNGLSFCREHFSIEKVKTQLHTLVKSTA